MNQSPIHNTGCYGKTGSNFGFGTQFLKTTSSAFAKGGQTVDHKPRLSLSCGTCGFRLSGVQSRCQTAEAGDACAVRKRHMLSPISLAVELLKRHGWCKIVAKRQSCKSLL